MKHPPRGPWLAFGPAWFARWQWLLLLILDEPILGRLARWVLCIRPGDVGHRGRIVRLLPHAYIVAHVTTTRRRRLFAGFRPRVATEAGPPTYTADFRTHWKFSKRIYVAFRPLWWALHYTDALIHALRRWDLTRPLAPAWDFGFDTLTAFPDPDPETTSVDGRVVRNGVNETFGTIRAGAGTFADDGGVSVRILTSTTTDQFADLYRGIALFDTSALGASAVVTAAVCSMYGNNGLAQELGTDSVCIVAATPASNTTLTTSDYGQLGTTSFGSISQSAIGATYNDITLNGDGLAAISKTGVTKFGVRFEWDRSGTFGGTWASSQQVQWVPVAAENTGTSEDPKLVVTYTPPTTVALRPDGDGTTTGWTRVAASGTFADKVVDDPDSNDGDTSYIQSPNVADGQMWLTLDNPPADFDPDAITSIAVRVAVKKMQTASQAADLVDLYLQLERSDESTDITTDSSVINVTGTSSYAIVERTLTLTGTHTLTDWQGARLRLRQDYTVQQMADSVSQIRISGVEVNVTYTPAADGIAGAHISASQLFAGAVTTGAVGVTGAFLGPTAQLFAGTVSLEQDVAGATIGPAAQLFAGSVAPGAAAVVGASIAASQLFAGSVTTGAVEVAGASIGPTAQLFAGTVTEGTQPVTGAFLASGAQLFAGAVTVGAASVTGASIGPTAQLFAGAVTVGAVSVTGALLGPTAQLFAGTVAPGAVAVAGAHLASGAQLFAGAVTVGAVSVAGAFLGPTAQLFAGAVTTGAVGVTGAFLGPTAQLFAGVVQNAAAGLVTLGPLTAGRGQLGATAAARGALGPVTAGQAALGPTHATHGGLGDVS